MTQKEFIRISNKMDRRYILNDESLTLTEEERTAIVEAYLNYSPEESHEDILDEAYEKDGREGIIRTFDGLFKQYTIPEDNTDENAEDDVVRLTRLALATNHLGWGYWRKSEQDNTDDRQNLTSNYALSQLYFDMYSKVRKYAYSHFDKEGQEYYHNATN